MLVMLLSKTALTRGWRAVLNELRKTGRIPRPSAKVIQLSTTERATLEELRNTLQLQERDVAWFAAAATGNRTSI